MPRAFPDGFRWGTATASHQIEGGNWNNDWWAFEHTDGSGCTEPSGDACDSWHRWPDDVALCAELGLTDYRFSVEWSRIEPEEGEFSRAALEHYRRMCGEMRERGIEPVVTFHHFTTPRWLVERGGWERADTVDSFARFCERVATVLGDVMRYACTINEPNIVSTIGYLAGTFPPGRRDAALRRAVNDIFIDAHHKATQAIKAGPGNAPVGLTLSMTDYQAVDGGEERRDRIRRNMEDVYLEAARHDDFIGVQTYSRARVNPEGTMGPEDGVPTVQMGYEFWPESLEATIRRAWEVTEQTPVLVTENGIGTEDDDQRKAYVSRALEGVGRCMDDGIDIRGYTYWSLLDNFEWTQGYRPKFGMVGVDLETFERTPKPSAAWLGAIARSNRLDGDQ
jgi:beta-glucosidase